MICEFDYEINYIYQSNLQFAFSFPENLDFYYNLGDHFFPYLPVHFLRSVCFSFAVYKLNYSKFTANTNNNENYQDNSTNQNTHNQPCIILGTTQLRIMPRANNAPVFNSAFLTFILLEIVEIVVRLFTQTVNKENVI